MSPKIMVVDDSLVVRVQVGKALRAAGYEVIEAKDGEDALEKLAAHSGVGLVICDINMPRMTGMELLERVRADDGPPVVMLTTEGTPEMVQRARALGAKGWITKPFQMEVLLATVNKIQPLS